MFLPLDIPPGFARGGTDLQSSGRWRDGSLIRWRNGILQPVGGWEEKASSTAAGTVRGALAWQDNSADRWLALGSPAALEVMGADGTLYDITPSGLTGGITDAAYNTGYGGGIYGAGLYGTPRPEGATLSEATTWSLDTWGEYLIACSIADGVIYEWQLNTGVDAAAVANAPTGCSSAFVTEERFLVALAPDGDVRRIEWSDRENNTVWTPAVTNEAGGFTLSTGGKIMQGLRTRGQSLILTDIDAHAMTFVGSPYVYGFERVGMSCGAVSRLAAAAVAAGVMWMGQKGFFLYAGGSVQPVPCEVGDYVFRNINQQQISKVVAVPNAANQEIWWFYPSSGSTECDSYVALNFVEGHWLIGMLPRTAGADAGVFRDPIWVAPNGTVYAQETGSAIGTASAAYVESGPFALGNGDQFIHANSLIPDELSQGNVVVTFKSRYYPNADEIESGPYSMAAPTDVRFGGRQVRILVEGAQMSAWRWGIPRLDVVAGEGR